MRLQKYAKCKGYQLAESLECAYLVLDTRIFIDQSGSGDLIKKQTSLVLRIYIYTVHAVGCLFLLLLLGRFRLGCRQFELYRVRKLLRL